MNWFSKIFSSKQEAAVNQKSPEIITKKKIKKNKSLNTVNNVVCLNGKLSDFDKTAELIKQNKFFQALELINQILSLPENIDEAVSKIETLLKDGREIVPIQETMGKASSGGTQVKSILMLGGHFIPFIMQRRGGTILDAYMELLKNGSSVAFGETTLSNPDQLSSEDNAELERLTEMANTHAEICKRALRNYPDTLQVAGIMLASMGKLRAGQELLQCALQADPNHQLASQAMEMVNQKLEQFPFL